MYTVREGDCEISYNFTVSDRPTDPKNCTIVSHFGHTVFVDNIAEYERYRGIEHLGQEWSYISIVEGVAQEVVTVGFE